MALLGLVEPALAAPQPFAVDFEVGRFEITRWDSPPPWQLPKEDRTCRIGLAWGPGGVEATDRGCPSAVAARALSAVREWQVRPPPGIGGHRDLGEIWFVYPFDAPGRPSVLVRQAEDRRWALPEGVDPVP